MNEESEIMHSKMLKREITKDEYAKFLVGAPKNEFLRKKEIEEKVKDRLNQLKSQAISTESGADIARFEATLA